MRDSGAINRLHQPGPDSEGLTGAVPRMTLGDEKGQPSLKGCRLHSRACRDASARSPGRNPHVTLRFQGFSRGSCLGGEGQGLWEERRPGALVNTTSPVCTADSLREATHASVWSLRGGPLQTGHQYSVRIISCLIECLTSAAAVYGELCRVCGARSTCG